VSGDEVHDLAEALRRLATLVARGAPPEDMFAAVAEEVHRRFLSDVTIVGRYEPGGAFTILGSAGSLSAGSLFPVGSRWPPGGNNLATRVFDTGRPARIENLAEATGRHVGPVREVGIRSAVGTPIIVEDRLWGVMAVGTGRVEPLPSDTEARLASFTELIAMAIANTQARTELAASRARIIAAADETRRQIQRDLHDGAQQRLVHAVIVLKQVLQALDTGDPNARELAAEALRQAEQANSELRELAHGILPGALTSDGLCGGLQALLSRIPLQVTVEISVERLPASVESTAYFIVSEALTNVLKHAHADHATVAVHAEDRWLRMEIRDDGIGGADPQQGSGLIGLIDRIEALGGALQLTSPPGGGTTLLIQLPVEAPTGTPSARLEGS
jgi:signal transduction histidine kinase